MYYTYKPLLIIKNKLKNIPFRATSVRGWSITERVVLQPSFKVMFNISLYNIFIWPLQLVVKLLMDIPCISLIFDPGRHVSIESSISKVGLKVDSTKIFKK